MLNCLEGNVGMYFYEINKHGIVCLKRKFAYMHCMFLAKACGLRNSYRTVSLVYLILVEPRGLQFGFLTKD